MENSSKNNTLLYILVGLLTIFIAVGIYIYSTSVILDEDDFKNNYKKIENIDFYDLPFYVQSEYIKKDECPTKTITKTVTNIDNSKVLELQTQIDNLKSKLINNQTLTEDIINSGKFKVARCYDMKANSTELTKSCKENITKLFDNKNIKYVEVIGLLDKDDTIKVKTLTKKQIQLLQLGILSKRVEETIWYIKNNISSTIKTFPANYHINSKYNHKGTIVRAYF